MIYSIGKKKLHNNINIKFIHSIIVITVLLGYKTGIKEFKESNFYFIFYEYLFYKEFKGSNFYFIIYEYLLCPDV